MEILDSSLNYDSGVFLFYFGADWCGPCKKLKPTISKLDEEFSDITFIYVDTDKNIETVKKYNVKSVPTLLLLKDGAEINRAVGLQLITALRKMLREG